MALQPKAIVGLKALLEGKDLELSGNKYFFGVADKSMNQIEERIEGSLRK